MTDQILDKPKRPLTAYLLWLNSVREQIKAENPGFKVTDIAKKGGELWRSMQDKSEWEEKAVKAKEQYARELERYIANDRGGEGDGQKGRKRGKKAALARSRKKRQYSDDEDSEESSSSEED